MAFEPDHPTSSATEDDGLERETINERVDQDQLAWVDAVAEGVLSSLYEWGQASGYSKGMVEGVYEANSGRLFDQLQQHFFSSDLGGPGTPNPGYYKGTAGGIQSMTNWAINWMGGRVGSDISSPRFSGGSGRGSRGSGRSGPTAAEIRNQFDMKQLTRNVDELSQSLVFDTHRDPKALARKYVDAVVAGKGEKNIDFETFVRGDIENTSRFKSIYKNKPDSVQAEDYMSPYFQAAMQRLRPQDAADVAIGGAQFGAAPEDFRARVERQQRQEGQAPFIQGLEGRLRELNGVLKG